MNPKLIAIYFPQFHSIPENDAWWGKNFTDWGLVKTAKPLFNNHKQPKIPLDENYYNPCDYKVLQRQVNLAKKYGIYGFMFYHYWFDGKLILQKPLETFLDHKELDFPFFFSWANASWTRQWLGNNEILLEQKHIPDKILWKKHFEYLLPFFRDSRYMKIDNKLVFSICSPEIVKQNKDMFDYWNILSRESNLPELYFIAIKSFDFFNPNFLRNYNAILKFQPREANISKKNPNRSKLTSSRMFRLLPERIQLFLGTLKRSLSKYTYISSQNTWDSILNNAYVNDYNQFPLSVFESAFFSWDNTARYGKKATIFSDLSKDEKKIYLTRLFEKAKKNDSLFIFFNAWNEWSESAFLEPDKDIGFENLEIVKEIFYNRGLK